MRTQRVTGLFYITHIDNISSILSNGILSHETILSEGVDYEPIYNENIVNNRKDIRVPDGRTLWEFANLYFQPRNPMLYRVLHEKTADNIAIISVQRTILDRSDIYVSNGNAASLGSDILNAVEMKRVLPQILRSTIGVEWWNDLNGSKRRIMAECLVPNMVDPEYIQSIYVASHKNKEALEKANPHIKLPIIVEPPIFFLPSRRFIITPQLFIAEGDMFFSQMQTLTVSVNTMGIMGKGLASRAKYQFPDVYVIYQDLCRSKQLQMGKPRIYKREASLEHGLADEPDTLSNTNKEKWFLLFPTKQNWRDLADINGIEAGLKWVVGNYKKEGIKSLAIPALGCGLGKLEWTDVGPLMCRYLRTVDIPVTIYLPTEKKIPDELASKNFLLQQ